MLFPGLDALIDIHAFHAGKITGELKGPAPLHKEGDIKGISVKMDQDGVVL